MSRNCQGILVSRKCMNPEDSPTSLSDIALFQFQNIMSLSKLNDVIILSPVCSFVCFMHKFNIPCSVLFSKYCLYCICLCMHMLLSFSNLLLL